jgi:hypothetical protein
MRLTSTFARLLASGPTSPLILASTVALAGGASAYLNQPRSALAPANTIVAPCGNQVYHLSVSFDNGATSQRYTCDPTSLLVPAGGSEPNGATVVLEPPY